MSLVLLACLCGLLGLAVGSFLNVVIYRVPRGESVVAPPSACPSCGTPIAARDNVPIVSWLVLGAKCRTCGEHISARYPLVEATTGILFAAVALRIGEHAALPAYLVMVAGLFALGCIDLEKRLLPRRIVYPLLGAVVVLLFIATVVTHHWRSLALAAIFAAGWSGLFFVINRVDDALLGFGDVRLALVLGFGLGWLGVTSVLIGFFGANLLGFVFGLTLIAARRWKWDVPIPYGTFLAIGAIAAILVGPSIHFHLRSL